MDKAATVVERKYLTGENAAEDATKPMGRTTHRTPGPTVVLRGIEANTNESKGTPITSFPGITEIEYGNPDEAPIPYRTFGDEN